MTSAGIRVKRTHFLLLSLADSQEVDIGAMLRGVIAMTPEAPDAYALAILTGRRERLSPADLEAVMSIPSGRWVDAGEIGVSRARALAERGLLVSDEHDERLLELRTRDAQLAKSGWNVYAAAYHFMTQREGVDVRDDPEWTEATPVSDEAAAAFVEFHGPPPPPFHARRTGTRDTPLPRVSRTGGLYAALAARETTRAFATGESMAREDLATVLQYVFGAQGWAETKLGVCIKRTSPSGGAMHPVEAYPLIADVEGIDPGLYHYDARHHALTLLRATEGPQVRSLATSFMCGQSYFGAAHVSLVLSARFSRSQWKYRRGDKAYAAVLMDAAHLSQTLYLVAAELRLGAFVTIAVNSREIERNLGLDGCDEGVVAIVGCGPPAPEGSVMDLQYAPVEEYLGDGGSPHAEGPG